MTHPKKIWSYEYPDVPGRPNCIPICRNIGDPYHELTEYACVFTGKIGSQFPRVIWAHDSWDIKFCTCTPAERLDNYRMIKMSNSITWKEREDLFFERFTDFPLEENQDGLLLRRWPGNYLNYYKDCDEWNEPANQYVDDKDFLVL